MRWINADTIVHWQSYDDEHETFPDHEGTIAEFLDAMTDEGCPESVDAIPVRRGSWTECKVSDEPMIDRWQSARCSVCGKYHTTPYLYNFDNFNFCSNCGADMREGDDDDT